MEQREFDGTTTSMRFASVWLSSEDLLDIGEQVVTIEKVFHNKDVDFGEGRRVKECFSIKFKEFDKQLVLNSTNRKLLVEMYGTKVREWFGKQVTLYVTEVMSFGELKNAVRIRRGKHRHHPSKVQTKKVEEPKVDPIQSAANQLKRSWLAVHKKFTDGLSKPELANMYAEWVSGVVGRPFDANFKWTSEDLNKCDEMICKAILAKPPEEKCELPPDDVGEFSNSDVPPPAEESVI